jgi:tetratricopeptide (TPR) repeat protein
LKQLVDAQPWRAPAWTRLARLATAGHVFDLSPAPAPIDEAVAWAQNAVRLDPAGRRARSALAAALLVKGELPAARDELTEALRLKPDSLVDLETIGWLLILCGDGERGAALCRSARRRNPHCLPLVSQGLFFDHLRRGEYEAGYRVALAYREPAFFWRALMRASCLGHLGREAEAGTAVRELVRRKPDFAGRGRALIGRLVKLEELRERIAAGLARAGLPLD